MKNEKSLKNDKRAVSPVIGVILMVAITVILAAVIAAFVFGYAAPESAPQASIRLISADVSAAAVTVQHQGGDSIVLADTKCIWTPDISAPATVANLGALATPTVNLGGVEVFDPGEVTDTTTAPALAAGKTGKLVIIHTLSGQPIFEGTIVIVA